MQRYVLQWPPLIGLFLLSALCTTLFVTGVLTTGTSQARDADAPAAANPILFVTQVPVPMDFTTIGSVFGNHRADLSATTRGGDLWIRYPDGTLKNLTAAAGYGDEGLQSSGAIAVRDPAVHWDGQKALFSMVVGAPTRQYEYLTYYWQIYEISGLGKGDTPVITKVPNQPANYNNITPIYGTDDRIIFTTDRPRNGERHLYPQLDEYEEAPTVSGLWSLDPTTGDLRLLNHAPSGDFTPIIDSYGRVIFTQWDHLQRDQQADNDAQGGDTYGTFNYTDESAAAVANYNDRSEVFPEPRSSRTDLLAGTNLDGHNFNHFLPWQIFEDGTEGEILNHLGRHELHGYIGRAINDDPNIVEYYGQYSRFNPNRINNMLQVKEDPAHPGRYVGIDAPEFTTHAAGQIIALDAPPGLSPDTISVTYVTHRDTSNASDTPSADHSGLYRDPLPLADGTLIVAHTSETRSDTNTGSREAPASRYAFRLKTLVQGSNGYWTAGAPLTNGISETITFWDPDVLVTYSGPLWEWQPVEVRVRARPARLRATLPEPESAIFAAAGVEPDTLRAYLEEHNLALIVSRNVTVRDDLDRQQPFNLRVPGGVQTTGAPGKLYDITHLQLFQADQLRGLHFNSETPRAGRRVLAQYLHEANALAANPLDDNAPQSSVVVAPDGSVAAFVPAQRALTWQLTDSVGTGVVRERNWITFQPGEIRVCGSCHGLSDKDQAGQSAPTNEPQALQTLLEHWKAGQDPNATPVPTRTPTATATVQVTNPPTPTATATATPKPTTAPPTLAGCAIFPGDNIWNTPIDDLPVAANSDAYIDTIGRDRTFQPDFGSGEWPPDSGAPIGIPFVTVAGDQKKVNVTFDYADESDAGPYPIPANAPIEGGPNGDGDRHVLMLDRDNCVLYELYAAYPQSDGTWQAGSGAIFDLKSHALRPDGWTSADAAGLPILPGLLRYDEVASGVIRHALRFTAPQTQRTYLWPARHYASSLTGSQYPPMGQRFRLRADFVISGYSPQIQVTFGPCSSMASSWRTMARRGIFPAHPMNVDNECCANSSS
ncbi:MAG: hypothetical protein R2932_07245 [Caldilineaceae bacterium]